ncbi:hypothetical protein PoB_007351800 [Plakobranchus ocellatus]|uniref:Uncharacterized protein n=1 Tax=Plakobranchus ocellatus TaxID=259542 RepID=A0AAV4DRU0_9GAST|nr:hypothetical protein PoB_007351800 [Plakobranchus ocellatus]
MSIVCVVYLKGIQDTNITQNIRTVCVTSWRIIQYATVALNMRRAIFIKIEGSGNQSQPIMRTVLATCYRSIRGVKATQNRRTVLVSA